MNISSIAGTEGVSGAPVYTATKHGVIGLIKSWGNLDFYEETRVRIVGICPGVTLDTKIAKTNNLFLEKYHKFVKKYYSDLPIQK